MLTEYGWRPASSRSLGHVRYSSHCRTPAEYCDHLGYWMIRRRSRLQLDIIYAKTQARGLRRALRGRPLGGLNHQLCQSCIRRATAGRRAGRRGKTANAHDGVEANRHVATQIGALLSKTKPGDPFSMTSDPTRAGRALPRYCQPAICSPAGERRCGARRRRRTHHVEPDWCNQLPSSANAVRGADVPSDVLVAPWPLRSLRRHETTLLCLFCPIGRSGGRGRYAGPRSCVHGADLAGLAWWRS
jgi:hypothetical protein